MKSVLVTADDFGFTKSVTDGVLKAHDEGIVTHTGLMVNMPDAQRAVELAKLRPSLSVVLHFNLTQGKPISDPKLIPSLVRENGEFKGLSLWYPRRANPKDIEVDLRAQIEKFMSFGFDKIHIDGHHYVTFIPNILEIVIKLSEEYPIMSTRMIDPGMIKKGVKRKIIGFSILCLGSKFVFGLGRYIKFWLKKLEEAGLVYPDALVSWELFGESDCEASLLKSLATLGDGITEIFGHPGLVDEELLGISTYTDIRERELAAFTSARVKDAITQSDTELINAFCLGGHL